MRNNRRPLLLIAILLTPALFLIFSKPVEAYIDPATTTYLIQVLSAVVITLGVTVGVFFGRIRQFFLNFRVKMTALGIRLFEGHDRTQTARTQQSEKVHRSFIRRFFLAMPVVAACFFTLFIFGVYELYVTNRSAFLFPLSAVLPSLILIAIVGTLLLSGLIALLRRHAFTTAVSLVFGLLLAFNLEGNLLTISFGELTGDSIPWELYRAEAMVNLLIWLVIFLLPVLAARYLRKFWGFLMRAVPAIIVMTQIIAIIVLSATAYPAAVESDLYLSNEGIYELGQKDNIVIIVLDRLDNWFIDDVLKEEPDFFDDMDGFTRFTNNISLYSQTFPSVANMLTGKRYDFNDYWADYLEQAWQTGDFIPRLREAGYDSRFFMERSYGYRDAKDLVGLADNVVKGKIHIDRAQAIRQFIGLSSYRYVPLALKPFFWTSTDAFGKIVDLSHEPAPYITDDLAFFSGLKDKRLSVGDSDKNFMYIHLNGPHPPYLLDAYGNEAEPGQSSYKIQTKGSFRIVFEYLEQLKQLGLYEDATIIVTGDHGARLSDTQPLSSAIVTGLFVKPKGVIDRAFTTSDAPLTSDHLRATVLKEAGIAEPWDGEGYFDVSPDEFVVRFMYHRLYASDDQPARVEVYQVLGDANRFDNWILVEEELIK